MRTPEFGVPFVLAERNAGTVRVIADACETVLTPDQARIFARKLKLRADWAERRRVR